MYGRPASTAATVDAWLDALDEPRRTELRTLHEHVLAVAPSLAATARVERQFLVYGHYGYNYASGRTGLWFPFGLASNAANIAVYGPPEIPGRGNGRGAAAEGEPRAWVHPDQAGVGGRPVGVR